MNHDYWVEDGESLTYELKDEIKSINDRRIGEIRWTAARRAWRLYNTNPDNWDYKYIKLLGLKLTRVGYKDA